MDMKGKPTYKAGFRYGYGAVDYYEGDICMENTTAGLRPQKLANEFEYYLNQAVGKGIRWSKHLIQSCVLSEKTNDDILKCIYNEFSVVK